MSFHARTTRRSCLVLGLTALALALGCNNEAAQADPAMEAIDAFILESSIDRGHSNWKRRLPKPPQVEFADGKTYVWKLVTSEGEMRVRLMPDVAPMHVSSTLYLTRLGFYDGTKFHRVIQGFMAQGGDPVGNGSGGPGYKYGGEFDPSAKHDRKGTLSMANAGPRTDGSQFFLTFKPTPGLDGRHTVFGRIEDPDSLATLEKIESLGAPRDPGRPKRPITLERATIVIE